MWSKISQLLLKIFSKTILGTIFTKLLHATGSTIMKEILDEENQKKAYEFVKELNDRDDLTNTQKAKEFNKKFIAWGKSIDKKIVTSVVNCLRELAVNAIKAELESEQAEVFS